MEAETKVVQLEAVVVPDLRKQMSEVLEEGRSKDEKVGRLGCAS